VHFDEARRIALSCGINLMEEWGKSGFIKKEKEFIKVLGPQDRKPKDLEDSSEWESETPVELIDVLHRILPLWEKGKRDEMVGYLQESGYGKSEAFYRVVQAISETLSSEDKEKKLLDGFLADRERLREEMREEQLQMRI